MSNMLFVVLIIITIVVAVVADHIRFNRQIDNFMDSAEELSAMYNLAIETLKQKGADVEFQGENFYLYVEEGDYKSLTLQTEIAICEVLERYDMIDKRYFSEMDGELFSEIERVHKDVENIQYAIRVLKWRNGWK